MTQSSTIVGIDTATIDNGASLSNALNFQDSEGTPHGLRLFAIVMPSSWTTANLTFQTSIDEGTTWNDVYDADGNEVIVVASASRAIVFLPAAFSSLPRLKIRSGTTSSAVAQGAEREIKLLLRSI